MGNEVMCTYDADFNAFRKFGCTQDKRAVNYYFSSDTCEGSMSFEYVHDKAIGQMGHCICPAGGDHPDGTGGNTERDTEGHTEGNEQTLQCSNVCPVYASNPFISYMTHFCRDNIPYVCFGEHKDSVPFCMPVPLSDSTCKAEGSMYSKISCAGSLATYSLYDVDTCSGQPNHVTSLTNAYDEPGLCMCTQTLNDEDHTGGDTFMECSNSCPINSADPDSSYVTFYCSDDLEPMMCSSEFGYTDSPNCMAVPFNEVMCTYDADFNAFRKFGCTQDKRAVNYYFSSDTCEGSMSFEYVHDKAIGQMGHCICPAGGDHPDGTGGNTERDTEGHTEKDTEGHTGGDTFMECSNSCPINSADPESSYVTFYCSD